MSEVIRLPRDGVTYAGVGVRYSPRYWNGLMAWGFSQRRLMSARSAAIVPVC